MNVKNVNMNVLPVQVKISVLVVRMAKINNINEY